MSENTSNQLGLGWQEKFLGGSIEAENAMIQKFVEEIKEIQRLNTKASKSDKPKRAFHALPRASMANAEFRVVEDIPEFLQVGFLKPGASFQTTVRFSNASGVPKPDTKKDLRGAAFRVHLPDNQVQDFLMTNAPANHVRDSKQFMQFATSAASGKIKFIPKLIFSVGLREAFRMLKMVIGQVSRPIASLATEAYWSRAPYAFGPYAVKYALFPSESQEVTVAKSDTFLREDIVERLKQGPVVFDFRVQLFINDQLTPIEDGAVEWMESDSPSITIAKLIIPQQNLTAEDEANVAAAIEKLAFNPWNTIAEIRPLSSLNRARKLVYSASAAGRNAEQANQSQPKLDAPELQELVLEIVKAKQPISAWEVVTEVRQKHALEPDEIRAAIFPLLSIGEIAFDKSNLGKLIIASDK